jgi:prepilin-type N-terminal cleavage/methylation domain-containing protein
MKTMNSIGRNTNGFTLVEVMLAVALGTLVVLMATGSLSKAITYFHSSSVQGSMEADARDAMATMTHLLQQGKASSTIISTPDVTSPPFSKIQFVSASDPTTHYSFFYSNGSVQMQTTNTTTNVSTNPKTIANHVTTLSFMGDTQDPASLLVTLRLDQQIDGRRSDSVLLANQAVHMVSTP